MSEEFRYIVRIVGVDVDGTKKLTYGLTRIAGIGNRIADAIVKVTGFDPGLRVGTLADKDVSKIEAVIKDPLKYGIPEWLLNRQRDPETGKTIHLIGPDLTLKKRSDIERMIKSRSWKGTRHSLGLKVRGQRTKTTGRKGRAVGIKRRSLRRSIE